MHGSSIGKGLIPTGSVAQIKTRFKHGKVTSKQTSEPKLRGLFTCVPVYLFTDLPTARTCPRIRPNR